MQSDSDDELCHVKDDQEESSGAQLSLFLCSPKITSETDGPSEQLMEQIAQFNRSRNNKNAELTKSKTLSMTINKSEIGRVSRTKTSINRLLTVQSSSNGHRDDTCVVSSDTETECRPKQRSGGLSRALTMSGVSRKTGHNSN